MNVLFFSLILILGDSHAEGYPGKVLANILNNKGYNVYRYTKVGAGVGWVIKNRIKRKVEMEFIFIGTNDYFHKNIRGKYKLLKKLYPKAYVIGPPYFPNNPRLDNISYEISNIQKKIFRDKFLDSRRCTITNKERYQDNIHFNHYGAKEWINCLMLQMSH